MFMAAATRVYLYTLSFLLREDYITSVTGLTGYFGHLKAWDVAAAGYLGIRSLLRASCATAPAIGRRRQPFGLGVRAGELCWRSTIFFTCLASRTSMYGAIARYGSGNTWYTGEAGNWWEAGVPMNVAYQPTGLLQADIGVRGARRRGGDPT